MAVTSHFDMLKSHDAEKPHGVWGWAKRLVDALNRWKLFNLMDVPINDKPYHVIRVNKDGTDFELGQGNLGLDGVSLVGKAGKAVVVNATEDGFTIAP